jgi:hypothetical protein
MWPTVTAVFHESIYRLVIIDAVSVSSDLTFTLLSFVIGAWSYLRLFKLFFVGVPKPFLGHYALEKIQNNSFSEFFIRT